MDKNKILIVEDEWIIFDELSSFLMVKGFQIATYTKSFDEAIAQIKKEIPDMVLLDINLQGDKDGIDLGHELFTLYKIPFIYLSAYADEVTVNRARKTNPDTFLIKTKPDIDKEQLLVSIKMTIAKNSHFYSKNKEGIFGYQDYKRDSSEVGYDTLKKVLVKFDDLLWIETDINKKNYVELHTLKMKSYLKSSLVKINEILPYNFVRINSHQVVNLKRVMGKVNHSSFKINNKNFKISKNYSEDVSRVLQSFYHE